jgi:hypothetical protein
MQLLFAGNKHKQKALKKGALGNSAQKPVQTSTSNSTTTTITTTTTTSIVSSMTSTTGTSTVNSEGTGAVKC